MSQQETKPPHPGEILQEQYFGPLGLTITEAAEKLGITRPNLSSILHGKAGISPVMALKLSKALPQTTADYWMLLQCSYDLWKARKMNLAKVQVLVKAKKKPAVGRL
ncbi:MAG TPA: HigA family addiction module antitoxin [Cyclobacteriaceae bacterium]|nr:HigA family addiction module antitoxin [Cyclobacteriaceae bacterium]